MPIPFSFIAFFAGAARGQKKANSPRVGGLLLPVGPAPSRPAVFAMAFWRNFLLGPVDFFLWAPNWPFHWPMQKQKSSAEPTGFGWPAARLLVMSNAHSYYS
jgi:hypothetical protein